MRGERRTNEGSLFSIKKKFITIEEMVPFREVRGCNAILVTHIISFFIYCWLFFISMFLTNHWQNVFSGCKEKTNKLTLNRIEYGPIIHELFNVILIHNLYTNKDVETIQVHVVLFIFPYLISATVIELFHNNVFDKRRGEKVTVWTISSIILEESQFEKGEEINSFLRLEIHRVLHD